MLQNRGLVAVDSDVLPESLLQETSVDTVCNQ